MIRSDSAVLKMFNVETSYSYEQSADRLCHELLLSDKPNTRAQDARVQFGLVGGSKEGLMWVLDGEKEGRMRLLWLKSDAELENVEDV